MVCKAKGWDEDIIPIKTRTLCWNK